MIVRGGVGFYTQQQLLFYINRVQLEGPDGTLTLSLSPDSPLFPTFPNVLPALPPGAVLPPRDIQVVDADLHESVLAPVARLDVERALFGALAVAADYVYLHGRDLMSLDRRERSGVESSSRRSAAWRRPTPRGRWRALPNGYRKIITLGNLGESWYHALQIKGRPLDRTACRRWSSYTLSHARGHGNYQLPEDSRNLEAERARADRPMSGTT